MLDKEYLEFSNTIKSHLGKECATRSELENLIPFDIPSWVWGFCIIAEDTYYFGDDYFLFDYKHHSKSDYESVKSLVIEKYKRTIITTNELTSILIDNKLTTCSYGWLSRERKLTENTHSFCGNYEDEFEKYCPLIIEIDKMTDEETMEFIKEDGTELSNNNTLDDFFDTEVNNVEDTIVISENDNQIIISSDVAVSGSVSEKPQPSKTMLIGDPMAGINLSEKPPTQTLMPKVKSNDKAENYYIPDIDKLYIKWGIYSDVEKIINHNIFYPCYVTGLSGNGKTLGIEQACAHNNREIIIANITQETDEDDLLGGYRLINGDTVWQDGPVITAMKRGAVLLLDEIDYGTGKLSCLQSVLSGKAVLIKKTGIMVKPKAGFTIFATANTKGQGDSTGKFAGTKILNEAFLDRFPITLYNGYPPKNIESKIMEGALKHYKFVYGGGAEVNADDMQFVTHLANWCSTIRKSFDSGAVDEVISTRRGVDILKTYVIFGKRDKAISIGVERFDEETRKGFAELYKAHDDKASKQKPVPKPTQDAEPTFIDKSTGTMWGEDAPTTKTTTTTIRTPKPRSQLDTKDMADAWVEASKVLNGTSKYNTGEEILNNLFNPS